MYNNHQGGIYTIRGDMCYENKIMTDSALSVRSTPETVRLSVTDVDSKTTCGQSKRPLRFRLSFLINAIIITAVGVLVACIELDIIPTRKLGYHCRDPSISFPFRGDTITATSLIVGSYIGPLFVLSAIEFRRSSPKYSIRIIWKWYKELLIGITSTLVITEVTKALVGEQRPHFITTCLPNTEATCNDGDFILNYTCTSTGYGAFFVGDSFRSFPSGHTAIAVFASLYCSVFLHYRLKARKFGQLLKPFLITICLTLGIVCSLTRITDRRHHWWDVLAGAVLGIAGVVYSVLVLVNKFEISIKENRLPRLSPSTTTLIDKKNKSATSVII